MKNQKNGVVILLIVIIVILLSLCILFATGTISLINNNQTDINNNQNDNQTDINNNQNNSYDAEFIAKEKMPIAISLANQEKTSYTYCGNFNSDDMIIVDTDVDYIKITMDSSSKFRTLEELKEHLKNNVSEELINKYFKLGENNYLEKDGKLYCQCAHKGFEWIYVYNEDNINEFNPITYTILNKQQNSFDVKIEVKYGLFGEDELNQLVTIYATIVKENDNWLVNKYEQE